MTIDSRAGLRLFVVGFLLIAPFQAGSQVMYERAGGETQHATGQDVAPVFEGWEANADGTFDLVFGYMNRNYHEEVDIPVGPDNKIEPGMPDQGQPTHFYVRRQQFVFKVRVPKDWGDKELWWTLSLQGKVNKVHGVLDPVWELGPLVYQENRRGPGETKYPSEQEAPPSIEMVGSSHISAKVGEPVTVTVDLADDGHPVPVVRRRNAATPTGGGRAGEPFPIPPPDNPVAQAVVKLLPGSRLGVTWVVYRGQGGVIFDPMRVSVADVGPPGAVLTAEPLKGRATTRVTFSEPGTYQLRAYGDDGILVTPLDVSVTVLPAK
jgi:hypothetical protein